MGAFDDAFKKRSVKQMMAAAAAGDRPKWDHLALAAKSGSIERLAALFELGMQPKADTLQRAAGEGRIEAMALIVERGLDVNAVDEQGVTALHYAALEGELAAIDWLVARGARIDVAAKSGRTALASAVKGKQADAARRLIALGAVVSPELVAPLATLGVTAGGDAAPKVADASLASLLPGKWKLKETAYATRSSKAKKGELALAADGTWTGQDAWGQPIAGTWKVDGPDATIKKGNWGEPQKLEVSPTELRWHQLDEEHGEPYALVYARR